MFWQVFYGALTYGIHSVGFDLLPSLVSTAQQLANQHQVQALSHSLIFNAVSVLQQESLCFYIVIIAWEQPSCLGRVQTLPLLTS